MIQNDIRRLLQLLLDFVKIEYQKSHQDRKQLHDEEWEAEEQEFSILGEAEIRADAVIGIVRNYLFNPHFDTKSAQETLYEYSIYNSKVLMSWLSEHKESYIQFTAYLHAIEHLRLVALDSFRKINELDKKSVTPQKITATTALQR